jgi:glycosyltransferase involved in cell wall biosynthesis
MDMLADWEGGRRLAGYMECRKTIIKPEIPKMRIVVFDAVGNFGGASRFTRALLLSLKNLHPSMDIIYYGNRTSIIRESFEKELSDNGIEVKFFTGSLLENPGFVGLILRAVVKRIKKYFPFLIDLFHIGQITYQMEKAAEGFDAALFPWIYLIECPDLKCPMIGVFHDFNFKYIFGAAAYDKNQCELMDRQYPVWLKKTTPVVSSTFMHNELAKFYPDFAGKTKIVHLAPFTIDDIPDEKAEKIVGGLGIKKPYLIYPTHPNFHKNNFNLIRAMYLLRKKHKDVRLVFTGPNTECLTGKVCEYGIQRNASENDIIGLGYVTNEQIDALIQHAAAVLSPSVYEAGNGPGLDAWSKGTPVIMSNIASFVEHLKVLGVRATLFDPTNSEDMAEKIHIVLTDYSRAKKDALYSQKAINTYTWSNVAEKYYKIIEEVVSSRSIRA